MSIAISPAQGALLAASAEAMFNPATPLNCALEAAINEEYEHVGTLIAKNALFTAQRIGLGAAVYFGFVVRHRHLGSYVIALRGTEQPVEWLEDAEALFEPHPLGGLVESGFWSIYRSMTFAPLGPAPFVHSAARGVLEFINDDSVSITVVGHSLGAPLAAYLALDLAVSRSTAGNVYALLYASPKPGDGVFGHLLDTRLGHDNYAVYNWVRDLVPRLPIGLPFGLGFQSLPNVTWLKASNSPVSIADGLKCNHSATSYAAILGAKVASKCITSKYGA